MSMNIDSRKGPAAEMNLTPLIDVLLVLIIIFMVVMPHHSSGEQAEIPQPAPKDEHVSSDGPVIVVQLRDAGNGQRPTLQINESATSWEELAPRLKQILVLRAERVVFLKSDDNVEFEYVAQVVDLTRAAGAERVGLMTQQTL